MKRPHVSIIVPIHNAGVHLHQCLTSLTTQTMQHLEIICVLDMPTDGSEQIVRQYAAADPRITIVENKQNLHIGYSRNRGIEIAKGEYIAFCDHDDYCETDMFASLYQCGKMNNADIVVSNFWVDKGEKKLHFGFPKGLTSKEFRQKTIEALLRGKRSIANTNSFANVNTIWHQLYRRDMLNQYQLRFDDNRICTYEDALFNLKVYHYATKVSYLPTNFYHHVLYTDNSFKSYGYNSIDKVLGYFDILLSFATQEGMNKQYAHAIAQQLLQRLYTSLRNDIKHKGIGSIPAFLTKISTKPNIQSALQPFLTNKELLKPFPITKKIFLKTILK